MSIPFTHFLRPNGRKPQTSIDRPPDIELLAKKFIDAGGWFESEHLPTGHASLTACSVVGDEGPQDIAIRVVENGPGVPMVVDLLVHDAIKWLNAR